ncbi:unnamed protein product, partial [Toxocara canis]|uniref:MoCoBD_2 domain-containing protein n=1 Tax=Toxocara canis TaxID=6265 RepID=A0A183U670_TOXCA
VTARCLGIDISKVHICETATDKVPNASPTAASASSDLNGLAIMLLRCDIVMDVGDSLNPAVDIGQIEGAFVQVRFLE